MDQNKQKKRVSRRSVSLLLVAAMLIALCVPTSMALSDEEQTPELSAQTATVPETSDTSESVPESDASDLSASVDADVAISSDGDTASDSAQDNTADANAPSASDETEDTGAAQDSATAGAEETSSDAAANPAANDAPAADELQPEDASDALFAAENGIETYAAGSVSMYKNTFTWLIGTVGNRNASGYHRWYSDNTGIATVSMSKVNGNDTDYNVGTVKGVGEGTTTITHQYWDGNRWVSETFTVTVNAATAGTEVEIYLLANSNGVPSSNETSYWAPTGAESTLLFGKVDTTGGKWSGDGNKNLMTSTGNYIKSWPDGSTGEEWVLTEENPNFYYVRKAIFSGYKASLEKQLGVTNLTMDDILSITVKPFKISRANCSSQKGNANRADQNGYHLDCTIDVACKKAFTAKFWVKYPTDAGYTLVDAANYKTGDKVAQSQKVSIGSEYTDSDGVTWRLDGWYAENATGSAYGNKVDNWNYTPSAAELDDGTVNFYAHYTAVSGTVRVEKRVENAPSGVNDVFTFNYTVNGRTDSFTLRNGQFREIVVPTNGSITVTESQYSTDSYTYTTTYQIDGGAAQSGNTATISAAQSGQTITFVNTYSAKTGALTLTKQIDNQNGALTDSELEQVKQNLSFTITSGTTSYTVNTGEHMNNWNGDTFQYTWDDLPVGSTWTVSESGETMDYANVSTVYDQPSATITAGAEAQLKITNTYTPVLVDLVINKRVVGENLKAGSFTFTARNDRTGITYTATIVTKDNGTATISGIPAGTYTVVELENDNYTCTNSTQTVNIPSGSNAVTFENKGTGDSFQSSSAAVNQYSGRLDDFRVVFQQLMTLLTDNH